MFKAKWKILLIASLLAFMVLVIWTIAQAMLLPFFVYRINDPSLVERFDAREIVILPHYVIFDRGNARGIFYFGYVDRIERVESVEGGTEYTLKTVEDDAKGGNTYKLLVLGDGTEYRHKQYTRVPSVIGDFYWLKYFGAMTVTIPLSARCYEQVCGE